MAGRSIGKFLELHIEQGPVLDAKNIEIGLVDCIVGIQRYMVTVNGRADHAGTTPMDMRLDAVDAATKVISKIQIGQERKLTEQLQQSDTLTRYLVE